MVQDSQVNSGQLNRLYQHHSMRSSHNAHRIIPWSFLQKKFCYVSGSFIWKILYKCTLNSFWCTLYCTLQYRSTVLYSFVDRMVRLTCTLYNVQYSYSQDLCNHVILWSSMVPYRTIENSYSVQSTKVPYCVLWKVTVSCSCPGLMWLYAQSELDQFGTSNAVLC